MPFTIMLSIVLVGGGASAAGVVGLASPKGQRMDAFLALVLGAGVGVAALAVGAWALGSRQSVQGQQRVILIASALGFAAVIGGLILLRSRARSEVAPSAASPAPERPGPA